MKSCVISLAIVTITLLGGCATAPDDPLEEPSLFGKIAKGIGHSVGKSIVEGALEASTHSKYDEPCDYSCREKKRRNERAIELSEARAANKESRERATALKQALDQRLSDTDSLEEPETKGWVTEAEKEQRSIILIDKPNEFD